MKGRPAGEAVLLGLCVFWGTSFALVRDATNDISPFLFVLVRFVIAAALFAPVMWVRRGGFRRETLLPGAVIGLFYIIGFELQTVALALTDATRVGFLTGLVVILVPLIDAVAGRRLPSGRVAGGVVLCVLGVRFLSQPSGEGRALGDVLALVCSVAFAFQIWFMGRWAARHDVVILSGVQIGVSALVAVPFVFFETTRFDATPRLWGTLGYLTVFATVLAVF
ncbi:MAG: DMT family transporter, partial [Planctomycetota bacterium]